jgi:hypothetical protein
LMRSKEAFAYSRSTGYFCSVAAGQQGKSPGSEAGASWDSATAFDLSPMAPSRRRGFSWTMGPELTIS